MSPDNLKSSLAWLAGGILLVILIGWWSGEWLLVLASVLLIYLGWLLFNTTRLYLWLGNSGEDPPRSLGLWSNIFNRIGRLQKNNLKQRRKYQAAIEEFRSMTNALPDATLVIDKHNNIKWFNDAACRLLGLRKPGDPGQAVTNLLRDPGFANWVAVEGQVEDNYEMASPRDANIQLSVNAVRYRGRQRLLIFQDVTAVHNLEQVRRDFVGNVSHELRTPLTVLLGYLESLPEDCPDSLLPTIYRIQNQAQQMQALVTDLLELSRLQSGQRKSNINDVNVPAMLVQLQEQAGELSRGKHDIRFDIDPELQLQGVGIDLESAFRNLISNAVNYTPSGGHISVAWSLGKDGPEFSVSDTGIGIPKSDLPRLTERFYRVGSDRSRRSGGTGLGLSIVKHVLNTHKARLSIESELGEGSRFTCLFPRERCVLPDRKPS